MNIWNEICSNLVMVAWFMLPLALCRLADITFGAVDAWKDYYKDFDWHKIVESIITTCLMLLGIALLVSGVVSLPAIMAYYDFQVVDTDVLSDMINVVMVVTLLIATTVTYGKDAFNKLIVLLKGKQE